VRSKSLDDKRKVLVYLPPNYESEPDRRYKVLYTQDSQSVFDERTAIHKSEWGLDEAAQKLISQDRMEDVIIVAVGNGGSAESRQDDYTPAVDSRYGGGGADKYLKFLTDELKPVRSPPEFSVPRWVGSSVSTRGSKLRLLSAWWAPCRLLCGMPARIC